MSALGERGRFLFRQEAGTIDAPTWRVHTAWIVVLLTMMTLVWWGLSPYAHRDLKTTTFLAPMTIVAYTYLIVFSFVVLLTAISWTMLSMKRLRDRAEPTGLAGLVPLLALFSGAAHFLQAQTPDVISVWYLVVLDLALIGAIGWVIVDLGFRPGRS